MTGCMWWLYAALSLFKISFCNLHEEGMKDKLKCWEIGEDLLIFFNEIYPDDFVTQNLLQLDNQLNTTHQHSSYGLLKAHNWVHFSQKP